AAPGGGGGGGGVARAAGASPPPLEPVRRQRQPQLKGKALGHRRSFRSAMPASRFGPAAAGRASLLQTERPEEIAPGRPVLGRLEEFVKPPARLGQQVAGLVEEGRALARGHGLHHPVAAHLAARFPPPSPPPPPRPLP